MQAHSSQKLNNESIRLLDIAIFDIASHDLYVFDRQSQQNVENSRIDLSTVFDRGDWQTGGGSENLRNPVARTMALKLAGMFKEKYAELVKLPVAEIDWNHLNTEVQFLARKEIVRKFRLTVKDSYERLIGASFPNTWINESATNLEQAAMRAIHDVVPAEVTLDNGSVLSIVDPSSVSYVLSDTELEQEVATYDGKYDPAYLNIPNPFGAAVNLYELDKRFAQYAGLDYDALLAELAFDKPGLSSKKDLFESIFAKGFHPSNNPYVQ
jgi:hypothetical protein